MKKKLSILSLVAIGSVLFIVSCTKDSEDQINSGNTTPCDTTSMSYASDIVPILVENCYTCHGAGSNGGSGGIILESYSNLLKWANNGYLVGNVTHAPGFVPMPYGRAKLPDCEVNKIVAWVRQGALNN